MGTDPNAAGPWIPATERTPDDNRPVLVWISPFSWYAIARCRATPSGDRSWHTENGQLRRVTHWAELAAPKEAP